MSKAQLHLRCAPAIGRPAGGWGGVCLHGRHDEALLVSASSSDLTPLLRKLDSISPLSGEERRALEDLPGAIRLVEPHQDIVRDKDQPSQCCLVLSGWVCRYKLLSE